MYTTFDCTEMTVPA